MRHALCAMIFSSQILILLGKGRGSCDNGSKITISPMADTWRDQNGHPRLEIDGLIIQLQSPFSFENEIGLCGPLVKVFFPIQDMNHMEAEIRRILKRDETPALPTTAVKNLGGVFDCSNQVLCHRVIPFILS